MVINDVTFNAELSDILQEVQTQLLKQGVQMFGKMTASGKDIMVCCPYHKDGKERRPSAGIRKHDGLFHCFTCGETHSLPEVISHCFGHSNDLVGSVGWNWLLKNFVLIETECRPEIDLNYSRNNNISMDTYVSESELDSYRYTHPYMYKRRLTDEIIEMFDIGYDKDTDCITFPVRDITGKTLFVARRAVSFKYFNYPALVEKPLYGIYELTKYAQNTSTVIVCESMLDCLTSWVYGKPAVALNGLGTDKQFKQLRELPCRKIVLATDNDDAGIQARTRIRTNVKNKIITEYIFPANKKDINDLTLEEFLALEEVF